MKQILQDSIAQILEEMMRNAFIQHQGMPLLQARLNSLAQQAYQLGVQDGSRASTKRNGG